MSIGPNPYSPPNERSVTRPPSQPRRDSHSLIPALIVGAIGAIYMLFSFINVSSGGVDRQAGFVLLLNIPVLLAWFALLLKSVRYGPVLGCGAVGTQGLITMIMLMTGIGDVNAVLEINGFIAVILAAVTAACFWFQTRQRLTTNH